MEVSREFLRTCANQHCFLSRARLGREGDLECIGIGQEFRRDRFGLFENLAEVRRVSAIRVGLIGVENPKGYFAADIHAAATLGAAVDAHSTAARGRVDLVDCLARRIVDDKGWNAAVARFHDVTEVLATRRKRGGLVAAALAGTHGAGARTIDGEQLGPGSKGRIYELESEASAITSSAATAFAPRTYWVFSSSTRILKGWIGLLLATKGLRKVVVVEKTVEVS